MSAHDLIRAATLADEPAVWPLARALATSVEPSRDDFSQSFHAILDDPNAAILVALAGVDSVVGYVHVLTHPAFHANGNIAWIEELFVAEEHRGTGAGRELMNAAENWAWSERHVAYIALATRRAADFYLAIGYDESATYFRKLLTS